MLRRDVCHWLRLHCCQTVEGLPSYKSVSCRLFAHNHRLSATANALLLQKSLERRLWDNSKCQVPSVNNCRHATRSL